MDTSSIHFRPEKRHKYILIFSAESSIKKLANATWDRLEQHENEVGERYEIPTPAIKFEEIPCTRLSDCTRRKDVHSMFVQPMLAHNVAPTASSSSLPSPHPFTHHLANNASFDYHHLGLLRSAGL